MYTERERRRYANNLRRNQTKAEKSLAYLYVFGYRPQQPVGGYVPDWYNKRLKIAVELNGSVHDSKYAKAHDKRRRAHLRGKKITVLTIRNKDALHYRITCFLLLVGITVLKQLWLWFVVGA